MYSPRFTLALVALTVPLAVPMACGSSDEGGAAAGTDPGLSTSSSDGSTSSGGSSDSGGVDSQGTGGGQTSGPGTTGAPDTGTDPQQVLARDLTISDMFVNQGVRVQIVQGGNMIPAAQRPVDIVAGRGALLRGYWELPDNWEARLIQGRLYVDPGTGQETMYSAVIMVDGEPFDGDLSRTFSWMVDPEHITADTGFRVELWEAKPGQEDRPEPEPAPVYPPEGTVALGVSAKPMSMKVTIVRIAYGGRTPEFTPEMEEKFYRYMYEQNALENLDLTIHPEILSIPGTVSSFSTVLSYLQDWHDSEVSWDHYYYGVIDTAKPDLDGAGGMAWSTVSAGLWWQESGSFPFKTFVHEIGHNQGRPHTPGCGAGSPDYNYPDDEGRILTWGYGVLEPDLKHPSLTRDYMSYCDPQWVSEWTWTRTADVIASLSGPPGNGLPPGQTGEVVIGYDEGGVRRWRTGSGVVWPNEMTAGASVTIADASGKVLQVGAQVQTADDGSTLVMAPVPPGVQVATATWSQ